MRNKKIDAIKFFAIISVICAHIAPTSNNNIFSSKLSLLFDNFGCVGVGIFLIISGYFFYNNTKGLKEFLKGKIKTIFIPWLFVGTLVYLFVFGFKGTISFVEYIKFIFGYGSYLYFLSVLILLYLIYYKLKKNIYFLNITTILSIISIILTTIFGYYSFSYLNILNWMIYFNIGIYIRKYNLDKMIIKYVHKFKIPIILINIFVFIFVIRYDVNIGYWSNNGVIYSLLTTILFINIVDKLENNKLVKYIGKNTMPIYLIHMPIAGVIVRISNLFGNPLIDLLKPTMTLLITIFVIYVYDKIFKKEEMKCLIGVR